MYSESKEYGIRADVPYIFIFTEDISASGGVRTYVEDFVQVAHKLGFEVVIASKYMRKPLNSSVEGVKLVHNLTDNSYIEAVDAVMRETDNNLKTRLQAELAKHRPPFLQKLCNLIKDIRPQDICYFLQVPILTDFHEAVDLIANFSLKSKTIAHYHGTYAYAREQSYFQQLVSTFNKCDTSVFLSAGDASEFQKSGISNATTIRNSTTIPDTVPLLLERNKQILFLGRLHSEKYLHELVEGWSLIAPKFPGWRVKICGEGEELEELRKQASTLGVQDSIDFAGFSENPMSEMMNSQVNVLTSHREGMPMSILEALAAGVPTVSYDAGPGTREVVLNDETGYIVPVGNIQKWAQNLENLLLDDKLRVAMGKRARAYSSRFASEAVIKEWRKLMVVERPPTTEHEALVFDTMPLHPEAKAITVALHVDHGDIAAKEYLLAVNLFDENGQDISKGNLALPWSGMINSCFINSPPVSSDRHWLKFEFNFVNASYVSLQVLKWGRKQHSLNKINRAFLRQVILSNNPVNSINEELYPKIQKVESL